MLEINLLDWRRDSYDKRKKRFYGTVLLMAMLSIFVTLVIYLWLVAKVHPLKNDNFFLQNKLNELVSKTGSAKEFAVQEALTKQTIMLVNQLEKNRDTPVKMLRLAAQIPPSIMLTSMSYQNNMWVLEGKGGVEVDQLMSKISKESALFSQVTRADLQMKMEVNSFAQPFKITAMVK